ncbi:MAG: hypothetical protein E7604_03735 [Ruminococcaceae bacterium]|nr:hypothetical protein [Oscillospiraceae bacterium]
MTGLRVTHARYEREHHCDAGDGAAYARIVVALQGCADIRAPGVHLRVDSAEQIPYIHTENNNTPTGCIMLCMICCKGYYILMAARKKERELGYDCVFD